MTLRAAPPGLRGTARYIPEAESLRGIAIVLVFFFHASFVATESSLHATGPLSIASAFIYAGHTGVTLFFVLSAFLLAPPFLAEAAGSRRVQRRHYFVRRALRILPAYYVAVLVANLLRDRHGWALLRSVPYLLFSQAIPGTVPQLGIYSAVWWSLATEVQFYLALPLLPVFLRTRLGRWYTAAGLLAYAVLYVGFDWYRYGGWSGRGWTLPNVGYVTLAGGISVLLAALSYRAIERPFLNWKSNVTL